MSFIKDYKEYVQDNPHGYWFKRKIWGWGWTPVTWQGWLSTFVFAAIVIALAIAVGDNPTDKEVALGFFLPFIIVTTAFIRLAYTKGEPPKWQWGFPKKDTSELEK